MNSTDYHPGTTRVMYFGEEQSRLQNYLPQNFTALPYLDDFRADEINTVVIGTDEMGWTQADYVLPRLASGLIFPITVSSEVDAPTHRIDAVEAMYMSGFADEQSGDCEAPCGHFYRVARWIVVTNTYGSQTLNAYRNEDEAKLAYNLLDDEYSKWSDD